MTREQHIAASELLAVLDVAIGWDDQAVKEFGAAMLFRLRALYRGEITPGYADAFEIADAAAMADQIEAGTEINGLVEPEFLYRD